MHRILNEIGKSVFGTAFKDILGSGDVFDQNIIPIDPSRHVTPDGRTWGFETNGNGYNYFQYTGYSSAVDAYNRCPPVSAIINRKAQAFTNGKIFVLNTKNKEAEGVQATKIRKLLSKPNPLQSWKQFEAQGYIYQEVFGFNIILPILPAGFSDPIDTTSMWNIPASWIDVKATEENFTRLGGISLNEIVVNFNGSKVVLQLKDLIIIRGFVPSFNTLTFPGSKLAAMAMPINNIIGAFESRNMLINYRGALGILSTDPGKGQFAAMPMDEKQKLALQQDFRRYGIRKNQFQVILTTASLKWQQMGYSTRDLMLIEEVQESTKSLCDGINFPPHLLGLIDPTYNNQNAAEKGLYQNSIIPDAESWYEQLTAWFQLDRYNLWINKDFSDVPVLQEDKAAQATARKTLNEALKMEFDQGLITLNQWLEKLGEDPIPEGNVRASDLKNSNLPLGLTLSVGTFSSLIQVITASAMGAEQKAAALEILFGISPADAERLAGEDPEPQNQNSNEQPTTETGTGQESGTGQQEEAN